MRYHVVIDQFDYGCSPPHVTVRHARNVSLAKAQSMVTRAMRRAWKMGMDAQERGPWGQRAEGIGRSRCATITMERS